MRNVVQIFIAHYTQNEATIGSLLAFCCGFLILGAAMKHNSVWYAVVHQDFVGSLSLYRSKRLALENFFEDYAFKDMKEAKKSGHELKKFRIVEVD